MRDHIRILGILNIAIGSITAVGAVVVLVVMGGIARFIDSGAIQTDSDTQFGAPFMATLGVGIAIFLLLLAAPSIIGGWGLMKYKPWSRVWMIVVSVFHCFHVPLGTALGVYGFWVLFNDETRRILDTGGYYVATAPAAYAPYTPPPQPPQV